ncbi:hypothetical protein KAR91_30245, partial [Candidatus Pacearchaeota archaeon]|nr:hypothetical protein [Candidatus Pacearchaeota archaeon]
AYGKNLPINQNGRLVGISDRGTARYFLEQLVGRTRGFFNTKLFNKITGKYGKQDFKGEVERKLFVLDAKKNETLKAYDIINGKKIANKKNIGRMKAYERKFNKNQKAFDKMLNSREILDFAHSMGEIFINRLIKQAKSPALKKELEQAKQELFRQNTYERNKNIQGGVDFFEKAVSDSVNGQVRTLTEILGRKKNLFKKSLYDRIKKDNKESGVLIEKELYEKGSDGTLKPRIFEVSFSEKPAGSTDSFLKVKTPADFVNLLKARISSADLPKKSPGYGPDRIIVSETETSLMERMFPKGQYSPPGNAQKPVNIDVVYEKSYNHPGQWIMKALINQDDETKTVMGRTFTPKEFVPVKDIFLISTPKGQRILKVSSHSSQAMAVKAMQVADKEILTEKLKSVGVPTETIDLILSTKESNPKLFGRNVDSFMRNAPEIATQIFGNTKAIKALEDLVRVDFSEDFQREGKILKALQFMDQNKLAEIFMNQGKLNEADAAKVVQEIIDLRKNQPEEFSSLNRVKENIFSDVTFDFLDKNKIALNRLSKEMSANEAGRRIRWVQEDTSVNRVEVGQGDKVVTYGRVNVVV